jgi:hypothetical protein
LLFPRNKRSTTFSRLTRRALSVQNSPVSERTYIAVSDLHRYRYARHKVMGLTIEEIAKEDGVKISTIESSVKIVAAQQSMYTMDALETSQIEVINFSKDLEKLALHDSLQAEIKVYGNTPETQGEVVATEPDYDVRLRASAIITDKVKAIISRHVKGNTQNTQVNVGIVNNQPTGNTFEDRLRAVLSKRELPPSVQNDLPADVEVLDIAVEKAQDATVGDQAQG